MNRNNHPERRYVRFTLLVVGVLSTAAGIKIVGVFPDYYAVVVALQLFVGAVILARNESEKDGSAEFDSGPLKAFRKLITSDRATGLVFAGLTAISGVLIAYHPESHKTPTVAHLNAAVTALSSQPIIGGKSPVMRGPAQPGRVPASGLAFDGSGAARGPQPPKAP